MALRAKKVFIDSSVFLAFIDRADPNHKKAVQEMGNLANQSFQVYTSIQNMQESYATLGREISSAIATAFLDAGLKSNIEIIFPQKVDLLTAYRIIKSNKDRQISFKEAINATLMQKRGIDQVVTFGVWHNLLGTYVGG